MKTKTNPLQKILALIKGNPIVVMLAVASLAVGLTIENFFSLNNLNGLMSNVTIRFLIALGISGCLITRGTDLSAGRQAALAATLTAVMVQGADYTNKVLPGSPRCTPWQP